MNNNKHEFSLDTCRKAFNLNNGLHAQIVLNEALKNCNFQVELDDENYILKDKIGRYVKMNCPSNSIESNIELPIHYIKWLMKRQQKTNKMIEKMNV